MERYRIRFFEITVGRNGNAGVTFAQPKRLCWKTLLDSSVEKYTTVTNAE